MITFTLQPEQISVSVEVCDRVRFGGPVSPFEEEMVPYRMRHRRIVIQRAGLPDQTVAYLEPGQREPDLTQYLPTHPIKVMIEESGRIVLRSSAPLIVDSVTLRDVQASAEAEVPSKGKGMPE